MILTINQSSTSSASATNCGSYIWNGSTYTASNTYTYNAGNNAAGCDSVATLILTINPLPTVNITGSSTICVDSTTALSPSSGGTWASSDISLATVTNGGVVTGVAAGSPTFTFTNTVTGCFATTDAITVNNCACVPPGAPTGSASQTFCSGSNPTVANLAATGTAIQWYDAASGGNLLTSGTALVNGNIYYASQTVNCESTSRLAVTVTVNTSPIASAITGTASAVCAGSSITFTDATPGGTWSTTSGTGSASVTGGHVTGVTAGSVTVNYAVTTNGCTTTATRAITVNATSASITGTSPVCAGTSVSLTASAPGGTWSTSSTTIATISATTGLSITATGKAKGTATISYKSTAAGCPFTATFPLSVNAVPAATISASATSVCQNAVSPNVVFTGSLAVAPYTFTYTVNGGSIQTITTTSGNAVSLPVSTTNAGSNIYALVSVMDANGCPKSVTTSITVTVKALPVASTVTPEVTICSATTTSIALTSTPTATFSFSPSITTIPDGTGATITGSANGTGATIAQKLSNTGNRREL